MSKQSPSPRSRSSSSSPALAAANNGNWHTAQRWSRMLRRRLSGRASSAHGAATATARPTADRAARAPLRAPRSTPSRGRIRARRSLVVLTGTDLYRDIAQRRRTRSARCDWRRSSSCCRSRASQELPAALRAQGTRDLPVGAAAARRRQARAGRAARRDGRPPARREGSADASCAPRAPARRAPSMRFEHIGDALDPALAEARARHRARQPALSLARRAAARARRASASGAPTCSSTRAAWKAARRSSSRRCRAARPVLASRIGGQRRPARRRLCRLLRARRRARRWRGSSRARHDDAGVSAGPAAHSAARRAPLFAPGAERAACYDLVHDAALSAPSALAKDTPMNAPHDRPAATPPDLAVARRRLRLQDRARRAEPRS